MPAKARPQSATHRFLLAIETDATRYHGAHASKPRLLDQGGCEQLLSHLAADLASLLPPSTRCGLVTAGALFDQTQVLRPVYPMFEALENLSRSAGSKPSAGHIGLGAVDGHMQLAGLQPEAGIPLGLLQILPLLVRGDPDTVNELATAMEHRFLEQGQVSAHTARWLESAFTIRINHARFMTLTDLNAMFRLQLEHFGFLPLWQLLDAALNGLRDSLAVTANSGQVFAWRDGCVHAEYQTFNHWSQSGDGRKTDSPRGMLASGYADWTRSMRQFLTVLRAHAVPLVFYLPGQPGQALQGTFFIEHSDQAAPTRSAKVTEHSFAQLGTICVSVVTDGRLDNYYPLNPQGLNDIHQAIREQGLGGDTVAFPGCILFDERTRGLAADAPARGGQH